ncbi:AAA family ATPase [Ectopseudomonas mendocina]|uniref:AAA family ATPase n=1 Tax=Ectopseudomonas mendocina TaxID=300 RepID=A0ABZ2RQN4_ECTME
MSQALIASLQNPALYPHPVEEFQVIETHISWVILTGPFVYKIKKPANFGFLDFTSLDARQHFCKEELRLNQRLTKDLYLEVLPITGSIDNPIIGGDGVAIEYALKMRQFSQSQLLSAVQARGELNENHIDDLARQIAEFHSSTPAVSPDHPLCSPEAIMAPMRQNFAQIRPMLSDAADLQQLDALESWTEDNYERLLPALKKRVSDGSIRECHGDIHLGNATLHNNEVVLFDCIEFNEEFRLIDVALDAAFLAMDLEDRGLKAHSRRFINAWLEHTGDYDALELLNFYKAYRALVRAKVALFSLAHQTDAVQKAVTLRQYRNYANLAESYSAIPSRVLAITHGVSGVGKSHVAMRLVEALGAIRLRSDVERKRLLGEQPADAKDTLGAGIYSDQATTDTYARLHQLAQKALQAGFPVVIDATYLKLAQRQDACKVAEASGAPFLIIECQAPDEVISEWIKQRQIEANDPSDATLEVVHAQQASQEALTDEERPQSRNVQTHISNSLDELVAQIRQRLPGI